MKQILIPALLAASLFASTYDYSYDMSVPNKDKKSSLFMYGQFEEIVRFDMLRFESDRLSSGSNELYHNIVKTIEKYKQESKEFKVSIIGHTSKTTDDISENSIDSTTYANSIQNQFRYKLDSSKSNELSLSYANEIASMFAKDGIDEKLLVVENRSGEDQNFSQECSSSRNLNNRVMVALYVLKKPDLDSDKDGVLDSKDKCPNTPLGVAVDKNGCCLDSDGDGVLDYKDKCPNTPKGIEVDADGCDIFRTLSVNFKTGSYAIDDSYTDEIAQFNEFLVKYPNYKASIIGHTDSVGSESANLKLSQQRAESIKQRLVENGIEAGRLSTQGKGESEPIASNDTDDGKKANRRIEVIIFE
ncbi:MAG: OmpA family protein [Arcobacteraceae bacterium]|nr:OmpA family protein [Arcobacteraceae bacterium]